MVTNLELFGNIDSLPLDDSVIRFAAFKHKDQRRKGADAEPYYTHLAEVTALLVRHVGPSDASLLVAALLHDTIEDTKTTYDELCGNFGGDVADLVRELTDNKALPKAERKQLQIDKTPNKSPRAKLIKIADLISNLNSTLDSPPADWSDDRRRDYFNWARKVFEGCRGINRGLDETFQTVYARGVKALGAEPFIESSQRRDSSPSLTP